MSRISRNTRLAVVVYLVLLASYLGASGTRLRSHSPDGDHFIWLAHGWLHGRLDLGRPPPHGNDWAQVESLKLTDGRVLRGAMISGSAEMFRTLRGEIVRVAPGEIQSRETKYYVSFPPFPAVLMTPLVAIWGLNTNDVIFTCILAPLGPALFFLLLRRLRARGDTARSESDDLWLTAVLGVGSVYFYSSVIGQVWYTAHVVYVILAILYVMWSLDARRPILAGFALGAGFLTRPEFLFAAPLFVWELLRVTARPEDDRARALREEAAKLGPPRGDVDQETKDPRPLRARPRMALRRIALLIKYGVHRMDAARVLRGLILFGLPVAVLGSAAAVLNYVRFGKLTEFGHTYLNVKWTPRIQKWGLFNYVYLGRNLACLLALVPRIVRGFPWVQVSWHGLAIWVTTPVILWVLWPKKKGALHRPLWITTACVAVPDLLYQNSGWVQFGYRFALDYLVFLLLLIAIGGRRFSFWWKLLVVLSVGVNLFGAITFGRAWQFYFDAYFPPGID